MFPSSPFHLTVLGSNPGRVSLRVDLTNGGGHKSHQGTEGSSVNIRDPL